LIVCLVFLFFFFFLPCFDDAVSWGIDLLLMGNCNVIAFFLGGKTFYIYICIFCCYCYITFFFFL
jgi:hypothetical protein